MGTGKRPPRARGTTSYPSSWTKSWTTIGRKKKTRKKQKNKKSPPPFVFHRSFGVCPFGEFSSLFFLSLSASLQSRGTCFQKSYLYPCFPSIWNSFTSFNSHPSCYITLFDRICMV